MCAIKNCPFKPSITVYNFVYNFFQLSHLAQNSMLFYMFTYKYLCGASLKMNENPTQIGLYYAHLIYHIVNIYALRGYYMHVRFEQLSV